jgi:nucleotide-binding universal stress UspA family protein
LGTQLRIVQGHSPLRLPVTPSSVATDPPPPPDPAEAARTAAATAESLAPGLQVTPVGDGDYAARALVRESESAGVVVVGSRGLGGFAGLLLGSVSHEVVAGAHCPVVVVPTEEAAAREGGPVVVGVDGSDAAVAALDFAFRFAAAHGLSVLAVQAWAPYFVQGAGASAPMAREWQADLDATRDALHKVVAPWRAEHPAVTVDERTVVGPPARALVDVAKDASLLVVGRRGRGEIASVVLGSVSHSVLHRADAPVAVVRATETSTS